MKSIFLAKRYIYPENEKMTGVFSNLEAATACARDSLYPHMGTVLEVDISNIQDSYHNISSYEPWETESVKTIYFLSDDSFSPPDHWRGSLIVQVLTREDTEDLNEPDDVYSSSEHLLIAKMAFLASEKFMKVVAIRDLIPGALAFTMLENHSQTIATGRGFEDRGELLWLSYHAIRIIYHSENYSVENYNEAESLFSSFWRQFIDPTSNGPRDWAAPWY